MMKLLGLCFLLAQMNGGLLSLDVNVVEQLAQTIPSQGTDWLGILAAYGVAAPFALLCLYFIRELRNENKELRDKLVDSFIPALTLSNKLHTDTSQVLSETTKLMHTLSGTPVPDVREINRATDAMAAMVARVERLERGI